MIIGRLNDLVESNTVAEKLQSQLLFLKEADFSQATAGRHEINEDLFFFLNEYETKEAEDCFWEAHQKYLDFHFILEGKENIAVDHIENQRVIEAYNAEKDAIFFEGKVNSVITMNPGDVMICFPEDSHMAGVIAEEAQKVRKVVLKVAI
ncbi:YhcH/YjgK/YiaL family protein [Neobacillus drentensis]|uniref:YhcH/YjgK/YiaL family protein n=1 Tax=Neobacillus drentensis TaxID=220684 RepID=UPI00082493A9|nr:YhcH/YjgK/YiaL family protein [Neobacillus drentensis]